MNISQTGIYHIYNRGNNQQRIFFNEDNYIYFLQKCHRYLKPVSEIFAWCLMSNHFHFLIEVTDKSMEPVKSGGISMPAITNGFRLLQSSYAKGVNKQQGRSGNLFQQKTKAKLVSGEEDYAVTVFFYIHQNPVEAGLINMAEGWTYSSSRDYSGTRAGNLCNKKRAIDLLGLSALENKTGSLKKIDEEKIKNIF
ncbi:MAG: transposase [Ferruginibacter sp.]|nr:transposase [Chitinophagaceae bacterium]